MSACQQAGHQKVVTTVLRMVTYSLSPLHPVGATQEYDQQGQAGPGESHRYQVMSALVGRGVPLCASLSFFKSLPFLSLSTYCSFYSGWCIMFNGSIFSFLNFFYFYKKFKGYFPFTVSTKYLLQSSCLQYILEPVLDPSLCTSHSPMPILLLPTSLLVTTSWFWFFYIYQFVVLFRFHI